MSLADQNRPAPTQPPDSGARGDAPTQKGQTAAAAPGAAGVNDARIARPAAPDSHPAAANSAFGLGRGYASPPLPSCPPVRRLPLAAFAWGGLRGRGPSISFPTPRSRGDHVLILLRGGVLRLLIGRREERLTAGDICWLPAGTAFALPAHPGCDGAVLLLSRLAVPDCPLPDAPRMASADPGRFAALWADAAAIASQEDPRAALLHIDLIALHLGALPERPPHVAPHLPLPRADHDLYPAFCDLARSQMGAGLTLADMAAQLGCDSAALDHACRARRGRRAVEVLNDLRIEMALALLRNSLDTPQQIAARLGFASHAHFCRAITAATGRGPRAFQVSSAPSAPPAG